MIKQSPFKDKRLISVGLIIFFTALLVLFIALKTPYYSAIIFVLLAIIVVVILYQTFTSKDKSEATSKQKPLNHINNDKTPIKNSFIEKHESIILNEEEKIVGFFCTNCGESFGEYDETCFICGNIRPICSICNGKISHADDIISLPCCLNYGHKRHIEDYIKVNKKCPICSSSISIQSLQHVKPEKY